MFRKTEKTSTVNKRKKERKRHTVRKTETYLHSMTDRGRKRHQIREAIQIEKETVTYLPRRRDRERNRRICRGGGADREREIEKET